MGYDFAFVPFNVEPENLEAAVRGMEALGFLGYNVSAPYKGAIVPYLHEISRVAEIVGADEHAIRVRQDLVSVSQVSELPLVGR